MSSARAACRRRAERCPSRPGPPAAPLPLRAALHSRFRRRLPTPPLLYFGSVWAPLVLSEGMFRMLGLCERCGLQPLYFPRHGEVVVNALGRDLPVMDRSVAAASFLSETA